MREPPLAFLVLPCAAAAVAAAHGICPLLPRAQVKDVWHGYSARAPHPPLNDKGITRSVGHLTLTRWVSVERSSATWTSAALALSVSGLCCAFLPRRCTCSGCQALPLALCGRPYSPAGSPEACHCGQSGPVDPRRGGRPRPAAKLGRAAAAGAQLQAAGTQQAGWSRGADSGSGTGNQPIKQRSALAQLAVSMDGTAKSLQLTPLPA